MAKKKSNFFCTECGYESTGWLGKCPACSAWNSFSEVPEKPAGKRRDRQSWISDELNERSAEIVNLAQVTQEMKQRLSSGQSELDRVLGGGFVKGSLVLLGGDPGIGKSTLLLQVLGQIANARTLYVSGEESPTQIRLRADRLKLSADKISLLNTTDFETIARFLQQDKPDLVVIDSIQTMDVATVASAPGSVAQVREATAGLSRLAKQHGISIVLVGHVTKDGALAGPRVLEHMVDAVLYFEGERFQQYRILRAVKNRFGTTDEIGLFEMTQAGLNSVPDAATALLQGRPLNVPGTAVTSCLEGTRTILLEVQALLSPTSFSQPVRMAQGVDRLRLMMLLAVLQKAAGHEASSYDAYVNVTGGMRIQETASDLALAAAIVSSMREKPIASDLIICGEIGLAGEIRSVRSVEKRVGDALRLGWRRFVLPASCKRQMAQIELPQDGDIYYVGVLREALDFFFH